MSVLKMCRLSSLKFGQTVRKAQSGIGLERWSSTGSQLVTVTEDQTTETATLTMNRPPVNSLNFEMFRDLTAAIKNLEEKNLKGFVLTSSSPTVFSSGLDIMEMYNPQEARFKDFWKSLQVFWKTLYLTPLITIAAVNGHAPAGGCMIALSCDYRIMVNSKGSIGMNETKLGIMAPKWFQALAINNIGFRQAEKALNLGSLFTPEEALSLGMIDELASDSEDLKAKAANQMALWLKLPGAARQLTKFSLRKQHVDNLKSYEEQETIQVYSSVKSEIVQKALGNYIASLKARKQ